MDEVRPAGSDDLAAVETIVAAAFTPWESAIGIRPGPLDEDYAQFIAADAVYVAGDPDPAAVIVLVNDRDHLVVATVAVAPERQGDGIGRALMRFAEQEAARRGHLTIRLYTHERMESNITWYRRLGYLVTGFERLDHGRLIHFCRSVPQ